MHHFRALQPRFKCLDNTFRAATARDAAALPSAAARAAAAKAASFAAADEINTRFGTDTPPKRERPEEHLPNAPEGPYRNVSKYVQQIVDLLPRDTTTVVDLSSFSNPDNYVPDYLKGENMVYVFKDTSYPYLQEIIQQLKGHFVVLSPPFKREQDTNIMRTKWKGDKFVLTELTDNKTPYFVYERRKKGKKGKLVGKVVWQNYEGPTGHDEIGVDDWLCVQLVNFEKASLRSKDRQLMRGIIAEDMDILAGLLVDVFKKDKIWSSLTYVESLDLNEMVSIKDLEDEFNAAFLEED